MKRYVMDKEKLIEYLEDVEIRLDLKYKLPLELDIASRDMIIEMTKKRILEDIHKKKIRKVI